ncbi:MAG: hypothetical protein E3J60_02610 [Dehalococcoidia bacterium]|nr:MAG: hypothetical protein E3J60_02610 [Dehalococcoidia bacterium]
MNEENQNINNLERKDKVITCCDCGAEFLFPIGEQVYFQSKRLSTPRRCSPCRQKRRSTIVPDEGGRL